MNAGKLILFGAGQLGIMLLARYFMSWVLKFADHRSPDESSAPLFAVATVGTVFLVFRIFDAVTDPIAGRLGDWWVNKGRQRRGLIWFSFALAPIGLALVFAPDAGMSVSLRWLLLVLGMFVFFVGYTLYAVPYWSLVEDYSMGNERAKTNLSTALGVGILVATGIVAVVSPLWIESYGYLTAALIFAVASIGLMVLPYFAAPKDAKTLELPKLPPLSETLKSSLTHRRFLAVILLFAGAQMALTFVSAAAPFIATRLLNGTDGDVARLMGPFLGTAVPAFFVIPYFTRRLGWERATLYGTGALSLAFLGAGLLGKGWIGSPMVTAMLVFASAGPGAAFVLGLEGKAIASCAEESEHKSVGIYFGVYNFIVKGVNGIALFVTGLLAAIDGPLAVRAMPITAGVLCIGGLGLYLVVRRQPASG